MAGMGALLDKMDDTMGKRLGLAGPALAIIDKGPHRARLFRAIVCGAGLVRFEG